MTVTAVLFPIMAALSVAQEKLAIKNWCGITEQQATFLDQFYSKRYEISKLQPRELVSCASHDYAEVNRFLKDHGFSIQLQESKDSRDLAVASILDIALTWKQPGMKSSLFGEDENGGKRYHAVRMKSGYTIRKLSGYSNKFILEIEATNNDKVYLSLADATGNEHSLLKDRVEDAKARNAKGHAINRKLKDAEDFALITYLKSLSAQSYEDYTDNFADALFPMIEINQQVDISWLLGLDGGNYFIRQALQQTKFSMNELGARIQSGVAIDVAYRCMPTRPSFVIDKPFYLWIERPGLSVPLLAAYVDYDSWIKI